MKINTRSDYIVARHQAKNPTTGLATTVLIKRGTPRPSYSYAIYSSNYPDDAWQKRSQSGLSSEEEALNAAQNHVRSPLKEVAREHPDSQIESNRKALLSTLEKIRQGIWMTGVLTEIGPGYADRHIMRSARLDCLEKGTEQHVPSVPMLALVSLEGTQTRQGWSRERERAEIHLRAQIALGLTDREAAELFHSDRKRQTPERVFRMYTNFLQTGHMSRDAAEALDPYEIRYMLRCYFTQQSGAGQKRSAIEDANQALLPKMVQKAEELLSVGRFIYDINMGDHIATFLTHESTGSDMLHWETAPDAMSLAQIEKAIKDIFEVLPYSRPYPYEFSKRLAHAERESYEAAPTAAETIIEEGGEIVMVDYTDQFRFLVRRLNEDGEYETEWE